MCGDDAEHVARARVPRSLTTVEWCVLPVFVCKNTPRVCEPMRAVDSDASNERID